MISEAAITWTITDAATTATATALHARPVPVEATHPAPGTPGTPPHPRDLAYVIFTSGTTGPPKAVGIEHAALARHITAARDHYAITPADRVLAFASLTFDASLEQLLTTLATGAQAILRPDEQWLPAQLPALISRYELTVVNLPPAYWAELVSTLTPQAAAELATLRLLILGGEAVPASFLPAWKALVPHVTLLNAYGPTEAVVTATACDITQAADDRSVPIGRPLPGRRVYITDPRGHLLPPGVPGKLLIGGPALARGYLNQPALTARKFTPDPYAGHGDRLYHTGDLARWLPDGTLEYLGRTDNQLKIRGIRIEPGEIEAVMSQCPGVAAAAVAIRADRHGGQILVGYYVSQSADQVPASVVREWTARYLPDFMRPSQVVALAVLPVTAGGKLDRAALPEVTPDQAAIRAGYVAPRDETERMIARIWTEVLGVDQVGIDDGFFDLGGHSLLATMAVSRIAARLGREVQLRALFENPRIRDFGPLVAAARRTVTAKVVPVDRGGVLPVSFAQERLWFLDAMSERGDGYLLWFSWRVRGGLDRAAWQGALDDVVARHEVLRTALEEVDGRPVQRVAARASIPLRWRQVPAGGTEAQRLAAACAEAGEFARQRFDLASAPLVRAGVWVLDPQDCVAVVAFHHVATDGWSGRIFFRELTEFYQGRLAGAPAVLAPLPVQYGDFAVWQRQWLSGGVLEQQLAYWREALSGVPVLELPCDRARPPVRSGRGGGVELTFPAGLVTSLEELGRRHGATLFMVLLAVFQVVLGRWSGQRDFAVGTPAAGRGRLELEDLIGFFVNTLVIRADLSGNPTFAEVLHRVRESVLGAFDHQEVPFERLVEELRPERDPSRNPLFQAMFDLEESATPAPLIAGLEFGSVSLPWEIAKFDLTATFQASGGQLALEIEYDSDLFDELSVVRLAGHVRQVLAAVAADPGQRVWELGLLSPEGRSELLDLAGQDAGQDGPGVLPLVFALPAAGPALACGDQAVSYPELESMVSGLTSELAARGATRGTRIGVLLHRGIWSIAAMLATWRAGGTYIPLDPAFPPDRLRHMISEAAITWTITDAATTATATALHARPVPVEATHPAPGTPGTPPHPRDLAYVIFTSGTTGPPKAVGIEHAALARHITAARDHYAITPADRVLAFASLTFDASLEQLLTTLATGAQAILRPDEQWTPQALAAQVRDRHVTVMELTPSYLAELTTRLDTLATDLASLRLLITGGEALPPATTRTWLQHLPGVPITNTYGPTEATICATAHHLTTPATTRTVPIGRPLPGRRVYITDPRGHLLPPGVPGELLIGGPALARGYLNQPALTARKFTPDPYAGHGDRLYHTGDLARWLPDGTLEYLGRTDNQLKIRGIRIEPGEIEAVLRAFPGARGATVLVRELHGEPSLIGYVAGSGLDTSALKAWCQRSLPDYMIPVVLTVLDTLPLTVQGKVDTGALPVPELLAAAEYVAPQSPTEVVIAQIWVELLGVRQIGLRDNFFALGGHSLRAVSAASRLRAAFGCPIDVRHLFEHPTVEDLSAEVERLLIEQISAMSEEDIGLSLIADPPN